MRSRLIAIVGLIALLLSSVGGNSASAQASRPYFLNAAPLAVGGRSYMSLSTEIPSGATSLATTMRTTGVRTLVNGGRSIFVSSPVPNGQYWDLSGTWNFSAYTRGSIANNGTARVRAVLYRVTANGTATTLATTADAPTNGFQSTRWTANTWSHSIPAGTMLHPGERYGLLFRVNVVVGARGIANGEMQIDSPTENSSYSPMVRAIVATTDAFARSDAAVLGVADSGHVWQTDGSAWGVCANMSCTTSPAGSGNYARVDAQLSAQRVTATFAPRPVASAGQAAVIARMTPDWSTYALFVSLDPRGRVEIWTLINGGWSSVAAAVVNTPYTSIIARTLQVRTADTSLSVFVDGNSVLDYSIPILSPSNATMSGIYADTTDADANNWPRVQRFSVVLGP